MARTGRSGGTAREPDTRSGAGAERGGGALCAARAIGVVAAPSPSAIGRSSGRDIFGAPVAAAEELVWGGATFGFTKGSGVKTGLSAAGAGFGVGEGSTGEVSTGEVSTGEDSAGGEGSGGDDSTDGEGS